MQVAYPRYHFLLIAPNLGAEWLFDALRLYWTRFRPTVISDTRLVYMIPASESVALTALAYRDLMPQLGVEIARLAPHAFFDPVPADNFDAIRAEFNRRAQLNYPFGASVLAPGQTIPTLPPQPDIPTPRVPTRAPAGFITQTPEPTLPLTPTPVIIVTSAEGGNPEPISPSPGPITGG
jgi:hypothetical protein